jgi:signal-transduction protein with cAMP-binding, CBS, and nucleotidyltransferase domain
VKIKDSRKSEGSSAKPVGNPSGMLQKTAGVSEMENKIRKFAKGDVIFKEGAQEYFMYDLMEGKVGIYAKYGEAGERLLTELNAEDGKVTFGEMGLIDVMTRSATAVALEDVTACVITGEEVGEYFKDNPEAVLAIMHNMSKRIRELTQDYLDACRVVAESVEAEKTGKEKSSWFREKVSKFIKVYEEAMVETNSCGYNYYYDCFLHRPYW